MTGWPWCRRYGFPSMDGDQYVVDSAHHIFAR